MYAVIETGGKQYRVEPGDVIDVERVSGQDGEVRFDRVLLVTGDDVVGRVVNLAARVTASAKGSELIVSNHIRTAVSDRCGVEFDGPYSRSFKGFEAAVPVYLASRGR